MNDELIVNSIDIGWPLNPRIAFPLDIRQFFTGEHAYEDAVKAAYDAIDVNVLRDEYGTPIGTTIPCDESGRDSVYYFGEPVVVMGQDKNEGVLYIIIKDEQTNHGKLLEIGLTAAEKYYEDFLEDRIHQIAYEEIEKLDVEKISGFIYSKEEDECGRLVQLNCIKIKGIKEVDGKIELDENASVLVAFDERYPYNEVTNPLATKDTVKYAVLNLKSEIDVEIGEIQEEIETLYGLHEENKSYIQNVEEEVNKLKAGETSVFELTVTDSSHNVIGDYVEIGTVLSGLTFNLTSLYDTIDRVKISANGESVIYDGSGVYVWPNDVSSNITFTVEVYYGTSVRKLYKTITFVNASYYGIMSQETYDQIKNSVTPIQPEPTYRFNHVFDVNTLDYIDCYKCYPISEFSTISSTSVIRGYFDDLDVEGINLDVSQRFFVKVYYLGTGYLCYVKDDPCRITNFKQTFKR